MNPCYCLCCCLEPGRTSQDRLDCTCKVRLEYYTRSSRADVLLEVLRYIDPLCARQFGAALDAAIAIIHAGPKATEDESEAEDNGEEN